MTPKDDTGSHTMNQSNRCMLGFNVLIGVLRVRDIQHSHTQRCRKEHIDTIMQVKKPRWLGAPSYFLNQLLRFIPITVKIYRVKNTLSKLKTSIEGNIRKGSFRLSNQISLGHNMSQPIHSLRNVDHMCATIAMLN